MVTPSFFVILNSPIIHVKNDYNKKNEKRLRFNHCFTIRDDHDGHLAHIIFLRSHST
jgi:hypothetical protein